VHIGVYGNTKRKRKGFAQEGQYGFEKPPCLGIVAIGLVPKYLGLEERILD